MKKHINLLILALLGVMGPGMHSARGDLEVSARVQIHAAADFDAPLSPYGTWVEVGSYGRCWHPTRLAVEWRPYCTGSWVYTDCGWYWVSDEPWAWACYHYGWWVDDPTIGWVWVPGIEWAPAWVEWRVGAGCIGWAPLPPAGVFVRSAPAPSFVFVSETHFGDPVRPSTVIVSSPTLLKQTTVITGIKRDTRTLAGVSQPKRVVINQGPSLNVVQKATGRTFTPTPVQQVARRTPVPQGVGRGSVSPVGREAPRFGPEAQPPPETRPRMPEPRPMPPTVPPEHGRDRYGVPGDKHGMSPPVPPGHEPRHEGEHGRDRKSVV